MLRSLDRFHRMANSSIRFAQANVFDVANHKIQKTHSKKSATALHPPSISSSYKESETISRNKDPKNTPWFCTTIEKTKSQIETEGSKTAVECYVNGIAAMQQWRSARGVFFLLGWHSDRVHSRTGKAERLISPMLQLD